MDPTSDVLRTIRRHALIGPDDRVAVALSGGFDSVALVWMLHELSKAGRLPGRLAGLIHVNHQLRGEESLRDEQFSAALARRLDLPIEIASIDVAAEARRTRQSIEAAARAVRYGFFEEARGRLGATLVATAHTLDDQAETVLLRLLRGAGGRGLSGIRLRRGRIIRPVLHCRRQALREYLDARGETACEDSSNASLAVARNQVRHRLLPVIEDLAPGGIEALARFASTFQADETYLEEAAAAFDLEGVAALPAAIARRVVRRTLERAAPGRSFSSRHLDDVLDLARGENDGMLDLPGVIVTLDAGRLRVERGRSGGLTSDPDVEGFEVPLSVPGRAALPGGRMSVSAAIHPRAVSEQMTGGDTATLQASSLSLPLVVRNRRRGDRLRPLGAPGRRTLQDLLVDRKVPRRERDRLPLVVDADGRIVWVAGVAIAEECRVTAPAAGVVVLKVHKEGVS